MKEDLCYNTRGKIWNEIIHFEQLAGYRYGTFRALHPRITLEKIRPLLAVAGITRLADITGLDWLGVPVYQAVRPLSRNLSVSQGKGLTAVQAKVSALMEAIELHHAEAIETLSCWKTVAEMRPQISYPPEKLALVEGIGVVEHVSICWLEAVDLLTGKSDWIPRDLCWLDLTVGERLYHSPFLASSNGLASGNSFCEALVHALCEVIERDSVSRARLAESSPPAPLDVSTVRSRTVQRLVSSLRTHRIETAIVDVTGPTGVPCFEVELRDQYLHSSVWGAGCHLSQTTAIIRAITEACQTRLALIAGTRDDLKYPDLSAPTLAPPLPEPLVPSTIDSAGLLRRPLPPRLRSFSDQVQYLANRIRKITGWSPLAIDLSKPDFEIPVVFVAAPGLLFDSEHRSLTRRWIDEAAK